MARPSSPDAAVGLARFDRDDAGHEAAVAALARDASLADGQPPFSDQSLLELRSGHRSGILATLGGAVAAVAIVTDGASPAEAELVVSPSLRRRGLGGLLLDEVLARAGGELLVWAHGDHPDARALAARAGLVPVRELLQLRLRPVTVPAARTGTTPFRPGADDAAWLALNALAFAGHAEQGSLTQADLDARIAADWFDADDFLVSRDETGAMTGFCWLKVDDGIGEFYAVGVSPSAQGRGLGRGLVGAGLARLAERGVTESALYVDADNSAAVALYRSVGFTDHSIDIQYARAAR